MKSCDRAPVSLKLIQSFGIKSVLAAVIAAGVFSCSQSSLKAGQAVVGMLAAIASRSWARPFAKNASTCGRVRLSFHKGAASAVSLPSSSIKTAPCICPQQHRAPMRAAASSVLVRTSLTLAIVPLHQSSGRCSDHPCRGTICSCSLWEIARMRPERSTKAARMLPVPTSIARKSSRGFTGMAPWLQGRGKPLDAGCLGC